MSNILTKDSIFIAGIPEVPATPGRPPTPGFCIDVPHQVPTYTTVIFPVYDDYGNVIDQRIRQVGPTGTTTVYDHQCYPPQPGTPGTPGQAGSPAHTDMQVGWNSGAVSIAALAGSGMFKFSIPVVTVGVVTGFNDRSEGVGYFEIDHGIYGQSGRGSIVENGVDKGITFTYTSADVFAIVRNGREVRYYKGSTLLYTSLKFSSGPVYADCAIYMGGDQITNASLTTTIDGPLGNQTGTADGSIVVFGNARDSVAANSGVSHGNNIRVTGSAQQAIIGIGNATIPVSSLGVALGAGTGVGIGGLGRLVTAYGEVGLLVPQFALLEQPLAPISGFALGIGGDAGTQTVGRIPFSGSAWQTQGGGASPRIPITSFAFSSDAVFDVGISGRIILPNPFTVQIGLSQGGLISGDAQLQPLQAVGHSGHYGKAVLQPLTATGTMVAQETVAGAVVLPALYSTCPRLLRGGMAHASLDLQRLTASGGTAGGISGGTGTSRDAGGAGALQALTTQGHLLANESIRAALLLSGLTATGNILVYGYQITGSAILAPLYSSSGSSGMATLPRLLAKGLLLDPTSVFEGWATNLRTGGTTRLANLPFLQMLQVPGGPLLGISNDGNVYELTGDKDIDQPIVWEFETGLSDMGEPDMKRVPYVYIDGLIQGRIEIAVLTDRTDKTYTYEYETLPLTQHQPHKRKLGNAIRTRSVGFRLSSVTGTYVEIDHIEPEINVTPRRV